MGRNWRQANDEDKGVEIVVDADLSVFAILDKLKAESKESRRKGELSSKDVKAIKKQPRPLRKCWTGVFTNDWTSA